MNNKFININKLIKIVALISIIFIFMYILTYTYSKYITEKDYGTSGSISKWHILVNNNNLNEESNYANLINCELYPNPNIAPDVIAPTSKGYFDLDLESTGTEVPFKYKFKLKDVDVDYSSSYELQWHENGNHGWGGNGNYTYQLDLTFDYSYLDEPIWYRWSFNQSLYPNWQDAQARVQELMTWGEDAAVHESNGWSGYVNNCPNFIISIQMPDNWLPNGTNNIFHCDYMNIDAENKILSFTPQFYSWETSYVSAPHPKYPDLTMTSYSTNKFSCWFQLSFSSSDISLSETMNGIVADGRVLTAADLPDFKITGYSFGTEEINNRVIRNLTTDALYDETTGFLSGTVYPPRNQDGTFTGEEVIQKFRFYVEWYDGPDNILDNAGDVRVLKNDNIEAAKITFAINVTQIN